VDCLAPAKQALYVLELKLDIGGASVIALAGMGRAFHLAQQGVHLIGVQSASGTDRITASNIATDFSQSLF
jgi:hypothetical protein